jgi:hypothetical protein
MLLAAGFVAAVYGVVGEKPLLGLGLGAVLEIAGHRFADFYSDKKRYDKARKNAPAQYGGKNTADISNKVNLAKNKPKPDKIKITASRNVVLNFEQRNCITNPRMAPVEMNPASLKHFIVNVGGMGVSSTAELPHGKDIEQRIYNTGLVRTKLRLNDDHHVYFARYRSDVVKNPAKQDMPEMYKEQIGDRICAVYRSRELVGDRYVTSLKIKKNLSLDEASEALEELLDNERFMFSDRGRTEFVESFKVQFECPNYNYLDYGEEMDRSKVLYMSGRVSQPVDTQAVMKPM